MTNIHSAYSKHDAYSLASNDTQVALSNNATNPVAVRPAAITNHASFPVAVAEKTTQPTAPPGTTPVAPTASSEADAINKELAKVRLGLVKKLLELDGTPAPTPPQPQATLSSWLRQALKDKYGQDIDPDHTYLTTLNYDTGGKPGQGAYPGKVVRKVSLTDAVRQNLQKGELGDALGMVPWRAGGPEIQDVGDKLPIRKPSGKLFDLEGNWNKLPHLSDEKSDLTYAYEGIYKEGQPQRYDASSQLNISPDDLRTLIRDNDPLATTRSTLISFWKDAEDDYPDQLRAAFVKSAVKLIPLKAPTSPKPGDLHPYDIDLAASMLDPSRDPSVGIGRLTIGDYESIDVVMGFDGDTGRCLLYVPGDRPPLHGFASWDDVPKWIANEMKDPAKRESLASHFAAHDRDDGTNGKSVNNTLSAIAAYPEPYAPLGQYGSKVVRDPADNIFFFSRRKGVEPFNTTFLKTKERSYADANTLVTSNERAGISPINPHAGRFVVNGDPADFEKAINFLKGDSEMARVIDEIESSGKTYTIAYVNDGNDEFDASTDTIYWNPHAAISTQEGDKFSPALALGHELAHAQGGLLGDALVHIPLRDYDNVEEWRVITGPERHAIHTFHQGGGRKSHRGNAYYVDDPLLT